MADISAQPIEDLGNLLSSYPRNQANIAQTQATTGLTNQETQGKAIENATNSIKLQFLKQMMSQQGNMPRWQPAEDTKDSEESGEEASDKEDALNKISGNYHRSLAPAVWDRQSQGMYNNLQQRDMLNKSMGFPTNFGEIYKGQFDAYNAQRQQSASNDLQMWQAAAEHGYAGLDRWANGIPSQQLKAAGFTDDDVKSLAAKMAPTALTYSGMPTERNPQGSLVLKNSGQEVPGVDRLAMSYKDAHELASKGQTWYDQSNMKHEGTTAEKYGMSEPELVNYLVHNGALPQIGAKGSPQHREVTTAAAKEVNKDTTNPTIISPDGQKVDTSGLEPKDVASIKNLPYARGALKPGGGGELNPNQTKAFADWQAQKAAAEKVNSTAVSANTATLAELQRMNNLIANTDSKNFGPGSAQLGEIEKFMHNWFGTPADSSSSRDVLTKVVGADQILKLSQQFHGAGDQVRLGAYETRIFMEALSASPHMTKEAMGQLLTWEQADAQYNLKSLKYEAAALDAGKEPNKIMGSYFQQNPKIKNTDVALSKIPTLSKDQLMKVPVPIANKQEYDSLASGQAYEWNGKTKIKQ